MERDPENYVPHYLMAWHHARAGDRQAEIQSYYQVLARNPDDVSTLSNLAVRLIEARDPGRAEELLLRAHRLSPLRAKTSYNLGYLFESRGQLSPARQWYRRALELNRDYLAAREALDRVSRK
jgi:tetratricopeptide (TPR) repeat protein